MNPDEKAIPRRRILLIYFLLGAAAVTYQSVLLREFMVLAFGNELAWGLMLFAWLVGVGLGAAVAGRFTPKASRSVLRMFIYAVTALTLISSSGPAAARVVRSIFELTPGQYVPLLHMVWLALMIAMPTAIFVGLCFPLACVLAERDSAGVRGTTGIYVAESLGSLAGGALFSFVLVSAFSALPVVAIMSTALLAGLMTLWPNARRRRLTISMSVATLLLAVLGARLFLGVDRQLDEELIRRRWVAMQGTDNLLRSVDSKYQNIALTKLAEQYSLYLDGLIATTFPDPISFAETAHLAACEHPNPKNILIVGGGAEGLISELLLHPIAHVDYVTLDPTVLEVIRPHLAVADEAALTDERVHIHYGDGRFFVKHAPRRYDLILVNSPGPASAMLNRTYTREFFAEAARILKPDGVLSFELTSAASYFTEDRKRYLASVNGALTETFEHVLMTWGTSSMVFACRSDGVLTIDPKVLRQRYESRRVHSKYFLVEWFDHAAREMLNEQKVEQLRRAARELTETPVNSDRLPTAYFYHLLIWDELTGGRSRATLSVLKSIQRHWPWLLAVPVVVGMLWVSWYRLRAGPERWFAPAAVVWSTATTGFASMSIELVLLFAFQSLYGYVYQRIGLIVALFMFGLAGGALAANRWIRTRTVRPRHLAILDLIIAAMLAVTPLLLIAAGRLTEIASSLAEALVMIEVVVAGLLAGTAFPICITLYRSSGAATGRTAGSVDAADHIGACLGALLAGVALVPVVGMTVTCLLLAWLKLTSVGLLIAWQRVHRLST